MSGSNGTDSRGMEVYPHLSVAKRDSIIVEASGPVQDIFRLENQLDHQTGKYRDGFRKCRLRCEQFWTLRQNIQMLTNLVNVNLAAVFVDFKLLFIP